MARKTKRKTQSSESKQKSSAARLLWSNIKIILALLVAAAVAVYWFRQEIAVFMLTVRDGVTVSLGLGVAPVALWLAVFAWALMKRRAWFGRVNLWLASLALVALTLGAMAFFRPIAGDLASFTLYGEVSLGGRVGQAIVGPVAWLGVLRLLGILILGIAVASPPLAADAAVALAKLAGKLTVAMYVYSLMGAKALWQLLRSKKAKEPAQESDAPDEASGADGPDMPPDAPSPYATSRAMQPLAFPASRNGFVARPPAAQDEDEVATMIAPEGGAPVIVYSRDTRGDEVDQNAESEAETLDDDADDADSLRPTDEQLDAEATTDSGNDEIANESETGGAQDRGGKFNKLWSSTPSHADAPGDEQERRSPAVASLLSGAPRQEWERPSLELMEDIHEDSITRKDMLDTAETIRRTLEEYGVEVEIGQIRPGPTVTMYGLVPGWVRRHKQVKQVDEKGRPKLDKSGKPLIAQVENKMRVKVDNILAREKDLALALKTPSIRIETPAMGKSQVGIEVPNPKSSLVTLRSVMESEEFTKLRAKAHLPIALGMGSGGEGVSIDLTKMPHLLIAGATGSANSVCLNTIVSCLILGKTPAEMRLLLVDPKRVELTPYNGIPHLLSPVVVDTGKVVGLLKGVIHEMLERYRLMEEAGVRNIEAYNKRMPAKMPFLVIVVDELADLMMSAAFDIEQSLCRLAQLGRATGIHLIVATQRPSVDVVTGLIKANFPSRISFGVSSQVDSRTILDTAGAEKLLGRGDMLYLPIDGARPTRVQGVYISDREIESLVHFWQTTPWVPTTRIDLRPEQDDQDASEDDDTAQNSSDELMEKAIGLAQIHNKLSTSLLQRRLRIGYPRAARLMDELEERGIVGPSDGSKSRDVIMNRAHT